jgi:sulfate permease, SulP family
MRTWWIPPTLRGYRRAWLGADALAGLALVAVALPSQMATALLTDLSPVTGLYAFVAGSLVYAVIGKTHQLSVGADSTIAPVLAIGVASVAVVGTAGFTTAMAFTALLVGGILILLGLFRMGWISEFLSTPVITGVLAGIAVVIIARQIPLILGVPSTGETTIDRLRGVVDQLGNVNGWSLAIGIGVLCLILAVQMVDRRLPGTLAALVISVVVVNAFGLASHHGVAVIGHVQAGLPHVHVPSLSWSQLRKLPVTVLTVVFLCVAQTAATVRTVGNRTPASDDFNRELITVGGGSIAAGFIGALAVDTSPPNTALLRSSGARSQLANLVAVVVVVIVLVAFTARLEDVPEAMLGATLIFIGTKLFRIGELRRIFRFDRVEFALATVSLVAVAVLGIEQGVLLAIVFSLADRTRRAARPREAILGREPNTDHWIPVDIGQTTEQVPGILVYLVYAPIWYGNADYLRSRILDLVDGSSRPLHAVVLDADGISDFDYTGLQAMRMLNIELSRRGVTLAIARASRLVHDDLKHGALLQQLGTNRLFSSVADAVGTLRHPA